MTNAVSGKAFSAAILRMVFAGSHSGTMQTPAGLPLKISSANESTWKYLIFIPAPRRSLLIHQIILSMPMTRETMNATKQKDSIIKNE
jgi:hypothetical protein